MIKSQKIFSFPLLLPPLRFPLLPFRLLLLLLPLFYSYAHLHGNEESLTLRYLSDLPASTFDAIAIDQLPQDLMKYHNQKVCIRGFLYRTPEGITYLAAEPDLKTCCVGSQAKISRQIMLVDHEIAFVNDGRVKEIQGRFEVQPLKDDNGQWKRLFVLLDARLIESHNNTTLWGIYLVGFLLVMIFLFYAFRRYQSK
jgi:hypothetical protein